MPDKNVAESYNAALKCSWTSIEVVGETALRINLAAYGCTDMTGAIAVAKSLMPDVSQIETYAGGVKDTAYFRDSDGEWRAVGPQQKR